jgi:hypothetical protein
MSLTKLSLAGRENRKHFFAVYYSRGKRENGKRKLIFKGKLMLAQQIKLVFSVYAFMVLRMFLLPWGFCKIKVKKS